MEQCHGKTYKFGGAAVKVVPPDISKEENEKHWNQVCKIADTVIKNMVERNET